MPVSTWSDILTKYSCLVSAMGFEVKLLYLHSLYCCCPIFNNTFLVEFLACVKGKSTFSKLTYSFYYTTRGYWWPKPLNRISMACAIITPNYVLAQGVQQGLHEANLKTLIYQTDYEISDVYNFSYHDGFFIYLVEPTGAQINFCVHLRRIMPKKTIFVLVETENLRIINKLNESLDIPIFVGPFAYRNIAGLFQSKLSPSLEFSHSCKVKGRTLKLDDSARRILVDGSVFIPLVNKEYLLMKFLFNNKGKIISKVDLLEFVWEKNMLDSFATVDVHVCKLRKKLRDHLLFDPIQTVHCAGYIFG